MKFIEFKKLYIKNFLSIGDEYVEVDFKKGLNIITGSNKDKEDRRNGVGKSAIADAIYFAVFGTTLRDIKKDFISNNLINDGAVVKLCFSVIDETSLKEIEIERTLSPSKVYLSVDGEDKTLDSISNTNSYIEYLLSTNQEIFKNCIILTINNTIPFMGMKKQDKRKFIESIFNLEVFSKMLDLLRADMSEVKNAFNVESTKLAENKINLDELNSRSIIFEDERKARLDKYLNRQNNNKVEVQELEEYFEKYEKKSVATLEEQMKASNDSINKVDIKINDFHRSITKLETIVEELKKQYKKMGTKDDKCPVCLKSVDSSDKNHIKTEKEKLKLLIQENIEDINKLNKDLDQFENVKKFVNKQLKNTSKKIKNVLVEETNYTNKKQRKKQLEEWLITLEEDIETVKNDKNVFTDLIKDIERKTSETNEKIEKIKKLSKTLDNVKFVVSEEGVKSYIIKKILELFNNKINIYLSKLDSNCTLLFDEYFEEKIINDKGIESCYNNFSGAEKKAIDLACMFSFMDIRRLQGDVAYNLCLFDELFDCSFDEKGVELVLEVLKERIETFNESCYIISHRKESIKAATGEIVNLEKKNGITCRVDFKEE